MPIIVVDTIGDDCTTVDGVGILDVLAICVWFIIESLVVSTFDMTMRVLFSRANVDCGVNKVWSTDNRCCVNDGWFVIGDNTIVENTEDVGVEKNIFVGSDDWPVIDEDCVMSDIEEAIIDEDCSMSDLEG